MKTVFNGKNTKFLLFFMSPIWLFISLLILIESNGYYIPCNTQLSWFDARKYCIEICQSDLAVILDDKSLSNLLILQSSNNTNNNIWIGIYDIKNEFNEWIDNTLIRFGNISNYESISWYNCIYQNIFGEWINNDCNIRLSFSCNYCNTKNYHLLPNALTFDESNDEICESHCNSSLASINTINDYQFALNVANHGLLYPLDQRTNKIWIGLQYDSGWKWIDGEIFDNKFGSNISSPYGYYPWSFNNPGSTNSPHTVYMDNCYVLYLYICPFFFFVDCG